MQIAARVKNDDTSHEVTVTTDGSTKRLPIPPNNSRVQGGYDAYFGTYTIDDGDGTVTHRLVGALSPENVGLALARTLTVEADVLTIRDHLTARRAGRAHAGVDARRVSVASRGAPATACACRV